MDVKLHVALPNNIDKRRMMEKKLGFGVTDIHSEMEWETIGLHTFGLVQSGYKVNP